ncbi:MAG: ABC1 kinase family protein [Tepidisphaerales bacterium]
MKLPSVIRSRFRFAGDLARAADIARILGKYGLAAWLTDVEWAPIHNALKSHGGELLSEQPFEARIRLALTDMGTTFIKFGQVLSTRPHVVGEALAAELSKLQAHTPADPPDVVMRTAESELGRPISECFRELDPTALASASIGQVHRARLKTGRRVIVKVQHPGIEGTIRRDLDILGFLADIAGKNEHLSGYQPAALIREFSRTLLQELDFRRELRNLQIFRRNFAGDETVVFPRPHPELTTGRFLTLDRIDGCSLADTKSLEKVDIDRKELARRGGNVFVQMIFRDGFYHADPHPGNLLILPGGKIGLLDAGMVGRIDEVLRKQIIDILMAAGDRDAQRLTDAVLRVCGVPAELDRAALSTDLTELFDEFGAQDVGKINVSGALNAITGIMHHHRLRLPGNLSMLIKCLILLEGTACLLNPSFNLAELLEPWRRKLVRQQLSPKARLREIGRLYTDWERTAEAVPKAVTHMIDRLENGRFAIHLEHQHLKSAANRVVVGMFISALLLASSILIARDVPPKLWGLSVLGMVGYGLGLVFGFRMLWTNRDRLVARRQGDWD